ncbi:hypothetical protein AB0B45_44120 [Nonomuraea sp. NPDC049152]|uniref:hypothetical protein n=1 Tax=Nonomuraea sp. NPDC049152 TaxID=3154350 RepID=UPI0033C915F9
MTGNPLSAGVYLLERWLPGIQAVIVRGEAPGELDEDWAALPSVERVARYGGFPGTFPGGGDRHPVSVERFEIKDKQMMFGAQRAAAGFPEAGAERALAFLTPVLEAAAGPLDRRKRALAAFVAGMLVEGNGDLLRIAVAAEPGGSPLDDEVHLLVRGRRGHTARLAVVPAASVPPEGRDDPEFHIACVTTLLSEFLYMNNNNQVTFEVTFGSHALPASADPEAADAAFRAGPPPGEWEFAQTPEEEAAGLLRRLADDDLEAVLADSESAMIQDAWGLAVHWDESPPEDPGDHLVHWLFGELLDTVRAEVTGDPGGALRLAYGAGLPLELAGDGACLVLVGSKRTGVIEIDDGY